MLSPMETMRIPTTAYAVVTGQKETQEDLFSNFFNVVRPWKGV